MGAKPIHKKHKNGEKTCPTCAPKDKEEKKKWKDGSVDVTTPKGSTFGEMDRAGIEAAEAQMKADPSLDGVDIKVRQVDSPMTSSGGWSRSNMDRGLMNGGALTESRVGWWPTGSAAPAPFGPPASRGSGLLQANDY